MYLIFALISMSLVWLMSCSSGTVSPGVVVNDCHSHNTSCDDCVHNSSCYYCHSSQVCDVYSVSTRPYLNCLDLKDMSYRTCSVSFRTLIIVLSSVGGTVVLVSIICCCCLCKKVRRAQLRRQLEKWEQKRRDQKACQEERRHQREQRREELRNKYGLNGTNTYGRFD